MLSSTPHAVTASPTSEHTATTPTDAPAHHGHRLSTKKFAVHFAEMVVAMAVGMVVLHPVWMFVLDAVGAAGLMHNPYTGALIMATCPSLCCSYRWRSSSSVPAR